MQHLDVSGAVRPLKWSLRVKWLNCQSCDIFNVYYCRSVISVCVCVCVVPFGQNGFSGTTSDILNMALWLNVTRLTSPIWYHLRRSFG